MSSRQTAFTMDLLLESGIFGLLILLVSPALLLGGVLTLALTRSRKFLAIFAALAFLPLLLGLCGTWLGYRQIDAAVAAGQIRVPGHPQGIFVHARREARSAAWLGGMATAGLLVAAGMGILVVKEGEPGCS